MKHKTIERTLSVLLLVLWILLLVRAHALVPDAFDSMLAVIIVGTLAVLALVVMSLVTKHPLPHDKQPKVEVDPGPTHD